MTNIYRYVTGHSYLDFTPGECYTLLYAGEKAYLVLFQPTMGARFISSAFMESNFELVR